MLFSKSFLFVLAGIFNLIAASEAFMDLRNLVANDKEKQLGNYKLKILGQSGKIRLSYSNNTENFRESSSIDIDFDSLIERNQRGEEVGKSGKQKHSFNNFAQLDFQITDFIETKFQNLSVFQTYLVVEKFLESSKFTAFVYIFNETGSIDTGAGNIVSVNKGTLKFSVLINNWSFCLNNTFIADANCVRGQNIEVGSFIDFTINIKGKDSAKLSDSKKNKFSFGDASVILPNYIKLDNNDSQMPDGYPASVSTNSTNSFIFRFPKFNSSVYYDPIVEITQESPTSNTFLIVLLVILGLIVVGFGAYCLFFRKRNDENRSALI
jgi:hypothetical protein